VTLALDPLAVDLSLLRRLWAGEAASLDAAAMQRVAAAAASVERIVASGETVYGVNTGFGSLAHTRIPDGRLAELQRNLILSHSAGLGEPLPRHVTRLMIVLKLLGLGPRLFGRSPSSHRGAPGAARPRRHAADPQPGQRRRVGRPAPLAHLIAALMGHGSIDLAGEVMPARRRCRKLGMSRSSSRAKEGLALINGTQAAPRMPSTPVRGERVFAAAIAAGRMSVDALKGSVKPFDPRLSQLRGQPGPDPRRRRDRGAARRQRNPRQPRPLRARAGPLQFPLPAAGDGGLLDLLVNAARTLTIEAGAVTDNPLVFPDEDAAISGGNFHAQPVAFAADMIAIALCEVGSLSERRTAVLIDPKMSGLPPFLAEDSGVNSGLMIPQVTAAALVAENRSLAFPASVDSIPTSAGQEDHVSMAPIAARKAVTIARNAAGIVAVELIAAAQGIDCHAPLKTSARLQPIHAKVRDRSPHFTADRYWADEMAALQSAVVAGEFGPDLPGLLA
jgi:histidine ammonia-lyase